MATLGTKWIDDLVLALVSKDVVSGELGNRIRASLRELVRAHNEREKQPPKQTPPAETGGVFSKPLVIVNKLADFAPRHSPESLAAAGIGAVAVIMHHGTSFDATDKENYSLFTEQATRLRAQKISVGIWGYLTGKVDPEAEARLAAKLCADLGADFYLANAEKPYSYIDETGQPNPYHYDRTPRFCYQFKLNTPPSLPRALLTYGTHEAIDYASWQKYGWTTKYAECFNGQAVDPKWAVAQGYQEGFGVVIPVAGYHQRIDLKEAYGSGNDNIAFYTGENFSIEEMKVS